jgi:queuine/archaeosine tRNA-ribosyltransferase
MTTRTDDPDDGVTKGFKIAHQKIESLLRRLSARGICPCCMARALAFHAATLAEEAVGSAAAIEMFEYIISEMREDNVPAPDALPSIEVH